MIIYIKCLRAFEYPTFLLIFIVIIDIFSNFLIRAKQNVTRLFLDIRHAVFREITRAITISVRPTRSTILFND